jgi:hypothetical protein
VSKVWGLKRRIRHTGIAAFRPSDLRIEGAKDREGRLGAGVFGS